jgi:S-DNA-T family DNA segregation ATPase FtsK/SpoIIIE
MDGNRLLRELSALALAFAAVFLSVSLASYSPLDPGLNQQISSGLEVHNATGIVGSFVSGILVDLFGVGAFAWPLLAAWGALACFVRRLRPNWWRWIGLFLLFVCLLGLAAQPTAQGQIPIKAMQHGGFFGRLLHAAAVRYLQDLGAILVWAFIALIGLQLSLGLSWSRLINSILTRVKGLWDKADQAQQRRKRSKAKKPAKAKAQSGPESEPGPPSSLSVNRLLAGVKSSDRKTKGNEDCPARPSPDPVTDRDQSYPPIGLLDEVSERRQVMTSGEQRELAQRLSQGLSDFQIQGQVRQIMPGPVVTMLEFKPAPGIKVSRIAGLSDDLARALKALAVRIEAPLPGKDTVGIEIPNQVRQTVYLREIVESEAFNSSGGSLPLALGKDIHGQPQVKDLGKMPHLLVAGATGTGKSVCLNAIIASLIFRASPGDLKLLLVDPKRIEMANYAKLPHLVHPVVTDVQLAKNALDWAVSEMERRYEAMARLGVRNIAEYNHKLENLGQEPPSKTAELSPMPYLVVIIDELADLMLTAGKEIEQSIVRLAQLARAAGIHLILATQRPSVDVVTGLIKANFPTRIAFQVSSKHDSRTILDTVGAQHLLGQGDLLYKGSAGRMQRMHGAFLSDREINALVDFWCQQQGPRYEVDLNDWGDSSQTAGQGKDQSNATVSDPVYQKAIDFVYEQGKGSISMLQRRLCIGFNRAARFIEQMERDGILGPQEGSKPRQVVHKKGQ